LAFFPLSLVLVGALWLLRSFEVIGNRNLVALLRLWPLALIAIGVELLVTPRNPRLGWVITVSTVVFALLFALFAPALGIGNVEVRHGTFMEPIGTATSAAVNLSPAVGKVTVRTVTESQHVINAAFDYVGTMETTTTGTTQKTIELRDRTFENAWANWWGIDVDMQWVVELSEELPIALTLNSGVSEAHLELAKLNLTSLTLNAGVGSLTGTLPASTKGYRVTVNGGVGQLSLTLPAATALTLEVQGGVGTVNLDVPAEAAIRLETNGGLGTVNVLASMVKISDSDGGNSVWESPNYGSASVKMFIRYNGGVGTLNLR
jgi:hypothetical protein